MKFEHGKFYKINGIRYLYVDWDTEFICRYDDKDAELLIVTPNDEFSKHVLISQVEIEDA